MPMNRLYFKQLSGVEGVVEWLRILEFGMPMALNAKAARILGVTLLITAASTLAGCASTPLTDSRSAQNTGTSKGIPDLISDTRPSADECHVLRDAFLDPARMSVNIFSLFGLPVVFIRDANCPQ
jgi:hypothetical protein